LTWLATSLSTSFRYDTGWSSSFCSSGNRHKHQRLVCYKLTRHAAACRAPPAFAADTAATGSSSHRAHQSKKDAVLQFQHRMHPNNQHAAYMANQYSITQTEGLTLYDTHFSTQLPVPSCCAQFPAVATLCATSTSGAAVINTTASPAAARSASAAGPQTF
jgi:hypothetical protein